MIFAPQEPADSNPSEALNIYMCAGGTDCRHRPPFRGQITRREDRGVVPKEADPTLCSNTKYAIQLSGTEFVRNAGTSHSQSGVRRDGIECPLGGVAQATVPHKL